ncbi:HepT-like ribonuclease domain-containing protein [Halarcobacter sp.]|uniref:HepT-like ribonuclease domain-containing protein n=1 Tax=Halarcobacter sp. TaxID=2321133 RepID=UPI002AA7DD5B|nr:HepT-like ribonuclease domain-containing protein [Halarcobacter sp.]
MYDKSLVFEILSQVENSIQITLKRFEVVDDVDYFTNTSIGMEKLDSICMQLIAIGESLKNIDKITNKELLEKYPQIDWKGAKGMRDIISHHYFDIDAKEIYDVCDTKLGNLLETIKLIKQEL